MNVKTDGIWVWTKKAEKTAKALGLDERTMGVPAWFGHSLLGQFAPKAWVESQYVRELINE